MMEVGKINQTFISCPMLWPHVNTSTLISILHSLDIVNIFHLLIYFLPLKEQHTLGSLLPRQFFFYFLQHLLFTWIYLSYQLLCVENQNEKFNQMQIGLKNMSIQLYLPLYQNKS